MTPTDPYTRVLAHAVLTCVGLFPAVVVGLNVVQASDGYDAGRNAVSDLALGRGGVLMALAFCSLGLGTLLHAALLRRTNRRSRVRTSLLSAAGLLSFVSAAFHTDLSGSTTTTHGEIHNAAGITTFALMLTVMASSVWRFRGEPSWRGFAWPTAVLTLAGLTGFLLVPLLGEAHFGVSQRILIASFLAWMLAGAAWQLRCDTAKGAPRTLVDAAGL
jgi:hypothetical membrane protein